MTSEKIKPHHLQRKAIIVRDVNRPFISKVAGGPELLRSATVRVYSARWGELRSGS
jgi:hypothetical protein